MANSRYCKEELGGWNLPWFHGTGCPSANYLPEVRKDGWRTDPPSNRRAREMIITASRSYRIRRMKEREQSGSNKAFGLFCYFEEGLHSLKTLKNLTKPHFLV